MMKYNSSFNKTEQEYILLLVGNESDKWGFML